MKRIRIRRLQLVESEISLLDALRQRAEEHAIKALEEDPDGLDERYDARPLHLWRAKLFLELAALLADVDEHRGTEEANRIGREACERDRQREREADENPTL